jgi:hypothetical protein
MSSHDQKVVVRLQTAAMAVDEGVVVVVQEAGEEAEAEQQHTMAEEVVPAAFKSSFRPHLG